MKKIISVLTLMILLVSVFAFSSCNKEQGKENVGGDEKSVDTVGSAEAFEFIIIRGDSCAKEVIDAVMLLKNSIEESTGKSVKVGTDYMTKESDAEIIVGKTKRDASKAFTPSEKGYVIDRTNSKIVIKGGTDAYTVAAVNYFIENYLSADGISLKSGEKYEYEYVYPTLKVGDVDLNGYNIVDEAGMGSILINSLAAKMGDTYGYSFNAAENVGEKSIVVTVDAALSGDTYKGYTDGTKIILAGADARAAAVAFSEFAVQIPENAEEGSVTEISLGFEGKTVPSVTESAGKTKYFAVKTDKDALSYEVGEEMVFDISLMSDTELCSAPLLKWSVSCEGGEAYDGYYAGGSGKIRLKAKMSMPGFAYVTVKACDFDGNAIEDVVSCGAGACAGRKDIKTAVSEPDDWEDFWKKQLERLNEVDPEMLDIEKDSGNSEYNVYDIKVKCLGDPSYTGETYSAIFVSYPKNAEEESLKIHVQFMGAGVRSTETHLQYKEDSICVSVNGHSLPSYMGDEYYSELYETKLKNYAGSKPADTDPSEVYYSYMVMRDLQALRFVKAFMGPDGENLWDGENISVSGMSEGGYQALFTAALDPDVTFCKADVPAMCDKQGITIGRRGSYGPTYESMLYYDTCFFAKRIKCPVQLMVGLGDTVCCPSGITAMYNELTSDKQVTYVQNMGHAYPKAELNQERFEFGESAK